MSEIYEGRKGGEKGGRGTESQKKREVVSRFPEKPKQWPLLSEVL